MTSRAAEIILKYVCPGVGIIFTNLTYVAPLTDLQTAVNNGQGLNGLNPTPWAFAIGKSLGWVAYSIMVADWFLFWADGPGLLISLWLNLGAVKLMYSAHYQKQTRNSMVQFLAKNEKKLSEQKQLIISQQEKLLAFKEEEKEEEDDDYSSDDDILPPPGHDDDDSIPGYEDDKKDNGSHKEEEKTKVSEELTGTNADDAVVPLNDELEKEEVDEAKDSFGPLSSEPPSFNSSMDSSAIMMSSSESAGKPKSSVSFGKQKSTRASLSTEEVFGLAPKLKESSPASETPVETPAENPSDKSFSASIFFARSKSKMLLLSKNLLSFEIMGKSFARRTEKMNEWGEIIWTVTSQQEPAKAPHEILVMCVCGLWLVVLTVLGFYNHYVPRQEGDPYIALDVVGIVVNVIQAFFYGAPLGRITQVVRTKKCDIIHFQSLVANTMNSALWCAYGIALKDPFVYAPCALGLLFAAIQFVCCAFYPRSKEAENDQRRFSLVGIVSERILSEALRGSIAEGSSKIRASLLGGSKSSVKDDAKAAAETMSFTEGADGGDDQVDEEAANEKEEDEAFQGYMSSIGQYSFLY